jgi:hypothetical protein
MNSKPEGLSEKGSQTYDIIMQVLTAYDALDTGGCKTFYSPAEWAARGEDYGTNSELVVVYDGGDVRPFFNCNETFVYFEKMIEALQPAGLYFEQCTGWYAAIYAD